MALVVQGGRKTMSKLEKLRLKFGDGKTFFDFSQVCHLSSLLVIVCTKY